MEAEITPSGDVMVEGQHVGQLNGFRFTSDPQAAGEEARTLNAVAQKALASEIEGRATRVSEAVDEAFVLANDGLIRWLGEPVGRIVAGAHILEPQIRLIADEQLTGPALELVQRRLDLWIGQHVTKLLGPLRELEKGEGLEGIAKGIAFQVAESLGVLERSKVADDVKNLPQDARATLRKLGVRFGAYHLYLPALVKPAPRALSAQLWALKNGGVEEVKGLDEVPHLAASGRTSFVADQAVPKGFYRAAGFRVCGERAVRVDILERLADLIRPAISYRPGTTPGDPPPGTADNDGFVVTVNMTSLAGCSGEAFGTILKSLGYVLDRRAGPPITVPLVPKAATEPVQAAGKAGEKDEGPAAADPAPSDAASIGEALAAPPADAPPAAETAPAAEPATELESRVSLARQSELIAAALEGAPLDAIEPMPRAEAPHDVAPQDPVCDASTPAAATPAVEATSHMAESTEPEPVPATAEPASEPAALREGAPAVDPLAVATDAAAVPTATDAPAEPVLIEVWRPHRHNAHSRRPAEQRRGPRRPARADAAASVGAAPGAPAPAEATLDERPQRADGQRNRFRDFKRPGQGEGGGARNNGRGNRPQGDKRDDHRRESGPREPRDAHRLAQHHTSEKPRAREKEPDPNSPFAKLAALKAQMEKGK